MRIHSAIFLLALALTGSNVAQDTQYFRYQRSVLNTPHDPAQTCAVLTPDVFAHAAPGLADLRLYRAGSEVPWALHLASPVEGRIQSVPPINLGQRDGTTVFDALMTPNGPDASYGDLELSIDAKNFIATVDVSGSNSGILTTSLGSFTIFDLTGQRLGRSTILHLPQSNFHTLHFRVHGPIPPSAITGISIDRLPASEPRYVTVASTSQVTQKARQTVVELTIPANLPVNRIVFVPGATPGAFSRDVSITATVIDPPNEELRTTAYPLSGTGNLLRVHRDEDGHRIDEERLSLDTDGAVMNLARKWVITIDNGDDPPLSIQSVQLAMIERQLCFEASSEDGYTLNYGDPQRTSPAYDYQRLFVAQSHPAEATLGPEQPNPQFQPRPDTRAFTEKHPALLWIALVAIVALLSGIALRTAKRTVPPNA